jgi:abortive infection bacteriophage resistance protein
MLAEKPPLTLSQQVELLENRGLIIKDKKYAENFLSLVNYYHFSGYCLSFEEERHKFIPENWEENPLWKK